MIYLNDQFGGTWLLGVDNFGGLNIQASPPSVSLSTITDSSRIASWLISVTLDPSGFPQITQSPVSFSIVYPPSLYLTSPNGVLWVVTIKPNEFGQYQLTVDKYLPVCLPKVVWPHSGSNILQFIYPPRQLSPYSRDAKRNTEYATFGYDQTTYQRVDKFIEFDMPYIAAGSDLLAWQCFLAYAASGGHFDYYPDGSQPYFFICHEIENKVKIEYESPGIYSYRPVRWRQVIS